MSELPLPALDAGWSVPALRLFAFVWVAAAAQRTARAHCQNCPACRHNTIQLPGTLAEAETGAPLVLPLTEHAPLLTLLLGLAGSRPSLRQQRFTFQRASQPASSDAPATPGGGQQQHQQRRQQQQAAGAVPLASCVFSEAPNPHALTDGASAVAVLLPGELGLPTDAFAGVDDMQVGCARSCCPCCLAGRAAGCPSCGRPASSAPSTTAPPTAPPLPHSVPAGPGVRLGQPAGVEPHCCHRLAGAPQRRLAACPRLTSRAQGGWQAGGAAVAPGPAPQHAQHGG